LITKVIEGELSKMIVVIMGLLAFIFFGIYDINQVLWKKSWLNGGFFIGFLGLVISTTLLLVSSKIFSEGTILQVVMLIVSGGFFLLLLYTLFSALPFSATYVAKEEESPKKVWDRGMYGLCRHPGFLWFTAAYITLAIGIQNTTAAFSVAVFIICNFLYVLLQDRWTFPHMFEGYENYKKKVPFLIPTAGSIKASFATIRKEG